MLKELLHSLTKPLANRFLAELEDLTIEEEIFDKDDDSLKKNDLNIKELRKDLVKYEEILEYICKKKKKKRNTIFLVCS